VWLSALGLGLIVGGLALPQLTDRLGDDRGVEAAQARPADGSVTRLPFVTEPAVRFEELPARPAAPPRLSRHPAAGPPQRIFVPRLGVDAPVVPIHVEDSVLLPPDDPQTLGWWAEGARPGARLGGALVTGHTVSTGGGAFDDLDTLDTGDNVRIRTGKGDILYRVTAVSVYRKSSLAKDAARVFSQTVPGRLVLITCEDWNGTTYLSNAVVFAELR
jgi:LPXTG-site transpeptidase (sortase) family protein